MLHTFVGGKNDGYWPESGPAFDAVGELLGTAYSGGSAGKGVIYKWKPTPKMWNIESFVGGSGDGAYPYGPQTFEPSSGYLYGTTTIGGVKGKGTVYVLTP